ncbi:hypothetical protein LP316_10280 [Thalassotalea sp. LPB0316]|uniref:hypothetical protein n=1 Tax=Thalassotalea sp. LPB0316 TaxID=2769490 RepID=UPI0018695BF5|nr:hypothetical protein [Thalassotalea sp. LPB0316]QOL24717.1 hypothetical protein LP316_10280 [Thalassotalea sp. LPB0316]
MKLTTGVVFVLIVIGHFIFADQFGRYYSKIPLNQPFDINLSQVHRFDIFIPMTQTYDVKVRFERKDQAYWYLNYTLGNLAKYQQPGIPLIVSWQLKQAERVIESDEIISVDTCKWTNDYVDKCLGSFQVKPGHYQLYITFNSSDKFYSLQSTKISVGYTFKTAHTWQTEYILWSSLFNYFVAPVILLLILVFSIANPLLKKAISYYYRSDKNRRLYQQIKFREEHQFLLEYSNLEYQLQQLARKKRAHQKQKIVNRWLKVIRRDDPPDP